jgi:predicted transcriptional regulator
MDDDPELRRLLWFLLGGSRGGQNRARIIRSLWEKPQNQNQLAGELGIQYKAVQHHVKVLVKSSLVVKTGEKYGVTYSLSPWLEAHRELFDMVCKKLSFSPDNIREEIWK